MSDAESSLLDSGAVSDAEITDELPQELNVSEYVGPYLFPNNSRRRIPAIIYLSAAVVCAVVWAVAADSPLVNGGILGAAIGLAAFAVYGFVCGKGLKVDESDALVIAVGAVGFPVGHASAQIGVAGMVQPPHLAHPALFQRAPARPAGTGVRGRHQRRGDRPARAAQSRRLG